MEELYQGIVVVKDEDEGFCIIFPYYTPDQKDLFEKEVEQGYIQDGRKIRASRWLEEALDEKSISAQGIDNEVFREISPAKSNNCVTT